MRIFAPLLALLPLALARCTKNENVSFVLTTYNATSPSLNNTLVTISPYSAPGGVLGVKQSFYPPGGNSVLPHFVGYDLFRYNGATQEKAYLEKRKEGSVIKFAPPDQIPEGAVTGPADIGCDYYGRHLLYFAGTSAFSLCKAKKKDGCGYLLVKDPTKHCKGKVDLKWIWIDYARPA